MKQLHVAVGLILHPARDAILIAQRPIGKSYAGIWEFPGGKIENGETVLAALARELQEELAIVVTKTEEWMQASYVYPDRHVLLDACFVRGFTGEPQGAEGQVIRWVAPETLPNYEFPAANHILVEAFLRQRC